MLWNKHTRNTRKTHTLQRISSVRKQVTRLAEVNETQRDAITQIFKLLNIR